ncbi:hypothetical protein GCM10028864_54120 [Microlunatus parietis]
MDEKVNLSGAWTDFWDAVTDKGGAGLTTGAAWIGLLIIIGALIVFLWRRTRGYADENGPRGWVVWAILFGAVLAAPGFLMPAILGLVDLIANTAVGLWDRAQNS